MFSFFGCEACGILAPQSGVESTPPALESEVPTARPPGEYMKFFLKQKTNENMEEDVFRVLGSLKSSVLCSLSLIIIKPGQWSHDIPNHKNNIKKEIIKREFIYIS